MKGWDLYPIS